MPRLKPLEVWFQLKCHEEDVPFVGNCSAIDFETDKAQEDWVRRQLLAGNEWAWCVAEMKASVEIEGKTFTASAILGCCSYLSEADFEACEGREMRLAALEALRGEVKSAIWRGQAARKALERLPKEVA